MDEVILQHQLIANFRPRIIPDRCVHIKRTLLGQGTLNAVINEEVKPDSVIGHYASTGGFTAVNVAANLNVSPNEASTLLQVPIGKNIYSGELLARKKTLFGTKDLLSPTDGMLESFDKKTGILRLKFIAKAAPLLAGVYGIVDDVNKDKGEVLIRTLVTKVYGVIGSGKQRSGMLYFLDQNNQHLVQASQIKEEMKGHILVAGSLIYQDALKKAVGFGVAGVVSGGLNFATVQTMIGSIDKHKNMAADVGISVVLTEGFGALPIGEDILNSLKSRNGRFVFINGNIAELLLPSLDTDSILTVRKIALPKVNVPDVTPEVTLKQITLGSKARVIWPPFMGFVGEIIAIDETPTTLPSGIGTYLLTLEISKKKIKVPYTNIELI